MVTGRRAAPASAERLGRSSRNRRTIGRPGSPVITGEEDPAVGGSSPAGVPDRALPSRAGRRSKPTRTVRTCPPSRCSESARPVAVLISSNHSNTTRRVGRRFEHLADRCSNQTATSRGVWPLAACARSRSRRERCRTVHSACRSYLVTLAQIAHGASTDRSSKPNGVLHATTAGEPPQTTRSQCQEGIACEPATPRVAGGNSAATPQPPHTNPPVGHAPHPPTCDLISSLTNTPPSLL